MKNVLRPFLSAFVLLVLTHCGGGKDERKIEALLARSAFTAPEFVVMGDSLSLRATEEAVDLCGSMGWDFTDEQGNPASPFGAGTSFQGPKVEGIAQNPGQLNIRFTCLDRNSDTHVLFGRLDVLDPSQALPSMQIVAKLSQSGSLVATVASLSEDTSGMTSFIAGQVDFDVNSTRFNNGTVTDLTFKVDYGDGGGLQSVGRTFSHTYIPGTYSAAILATNPKGNSIRVSFTMYIKCASPIPLVLNANNIQITPGKDHNYFNFDAGTAVTGGNGTRKYAWDFNGDGIPDGDGIGNAWTANAKLTNVYVHYAGTRRPKLYVTDSCYQFASTDKTFAFNIPQPSNQQPNGIPGVAQGPQLPGYFFIFGDIAPVSNWSKSYDFGATENFGANPKLHVLGSWKKDQASDGTFRSCVNTVELKGVTNYQPNVNQFSSLWRENGMHIWLTFHDCTAVTGAHITPYFPPYLTGVEFTTDGTGDVGSMIKFIGKLSTCSATLTPIVAPGAGPCSSGNGAQNLSATFDGTFKCDIAQTYNGTRSVNILNGAFYFESGPVDACIGGGGGGGGTPPPKQ